MLFKTVSTVPDLTAYEVILELKETKILVDKISALLLLRRCISLSTWQGFRNRDIFITTPLWSEQRFKIPRQKYENSRSQDKMNKEVSRHAKIFSQRKN